MGRSRDEEGGVLLRKSPHSGDEFVEAWRRLRGEYLVQFYRELRAAIPKDKSIYAGIPRGRYLS